MPYMPQDKAVFISIHAPLRERLTQVMHFKI